MTRLLWLVMLGGTTCLAAWFLNSPQFVEKTSGSHPVQYEGVPRIIDGDTFEIKGERVRLADIDTCEMGQTATLAGSLIDCGAWARDSISELIGPRKVRCESTERDFYDRALATCYLGDRDLNATIVRNGIGFAYKRSTRYRAEETQAREAGRGVWLFSDVEEPSQYRRQN